MHLKACIEKSFGKEITDERLRQSIAIYNKNRKLLNYLYDIRRSSPALFHAGDLVTVVVASMLMPKEEHNNLLTNLITSVHRAGKVMDDKPRLILSNLCDQPKRGILELIDQTGAVVADDDLYTGSRYFSTLVDETISPIEALVERYIHDVPCPTKSNVKDDWGDYLINMVKKADANGVIILLVRFCEPHGFDYPYLKHKLSGAGIPNLLIETEAKGSFHLEQVRTRLQAFIEGL
jgi:benzoyl-CoA reductase subunit C